MFDFLTHLFDTSGFPPRWQCGSWTDAHGWLHILSDLAVWSAYFAIPCILVYFVLRRRDVPFRAIFWLFGAFILACGTTHLMEAIIFWHPLYRLAGVIKLLTAIVSWGTVVALVPIIPKALAMRSPEELDQEITARKKAENALHQANVELEQQVKALRTSEERFRLLVNGTKDHAIIMLDPTGRVVSWNPGAECIYQYHANEIIGQHFSHFYPSEEIRSGKPEELLRVAAAKGVYEGEGWRVRKDGTKFRASVVITALRDDTEKARRFSIITRDITERKQAEENARRLLQEEAARRAAEEQAQEIEKQREQLRVTLRSIGDGVIATDAEGRVTLLNPVAEALTGWKNEDAAGKPLQSVFHIVNETTRQVVGNPIGKALATGQIVGLANHTILIAKDGTERPIHDSAAPIGDEQGRVIGVVLVFQDITERRRAEEELRKSTEQLQIVTEGMAALVTRCSRDFRYLWASEPYAEWIGRPAAEIIGSPILDILGEEAFRQLLPQFEQVLTGKKVQYEEEVNCRGLGLRWLNAIYTPTFDKADVPDGWVAVVIDITERRKMEEALRDSEQRFARFMQHLPGLAWIKDLQGRYVYANDAAMKVFCYTQDGLYGKTDDEVFPLETATQFKENDSKALASGTGVQTIETLEHRDGIVHSSVVNKFPILGMDGNPSLVGGMAIDITDLKRAEQTLRKSEERLRLALDGGRMGVWEWNLRTNEVWWSDNLESIHGLAPGSFDGTLAAFERLIHPDDREAVHHAIAHAIEGRQNYDIEFRNVWPDGDVRWMAAKGKSFCDDKGQPVRMIGVGMDVTDRRRAEETVRSLLRISERLNSTLDVDTLLDILVQEAIRLVNAESGVSGLHAPEGMVCRKYFQKGKPLPLEYCWPPMHGLPGWLIVHKRPYLTNDALTDAQIVHELCVQFGVRSALSTPILSAQGEVLGFFELHNKESDFTPFDQEKLLAVSHAASIAIQNALAYRRIQQTEESLREADRRKNDFLATLAHELRNPLAPIRTCLELLRLADSNTDVMEQARNMMGRQVGQMARLIDDLLDISRITKGRLQLRKERVELAAVARNAVETSHPLIKASNHELTVTLPPDPIYLNADPIRLDQVIANLLTNAAKYTEKGGDIWLTVERQGGEAVVSVRDTGIGIATEHLPHIFEMFSQVEPALERSQGGLGIGLALVRGLVELHGGTVEAHSGGTGMGSEFIVHLPIVEAPVEAQEKPTGDDETARTHRKCRILVVDDNRDAVEAFVMILGMLGHETDTAYDGLEAVQAVERFRPEVVLLDIGLPKMNGYEVARHIREIPGGKVVALVALTGWGQEEDKRRATEAGFDHHLTKPVDFACLEKLLATLTVPGQS